MSNKLVKKDTDVKQRYVGDSSKVVRVVESTWKEENKRWKYMRVKGFLIASAAMVSLAYTVDGTLYSICNKIGTVVGISGKYLLFSVAVTQLLVMLFGTERMWYAHIHCLQRGI